MQDQYSRRKSDLRPNTNLPKAAENRVKYVPISHRVKSILGQGLADHLANPINMVSLADQRRRQ